VSTSSRRSRPLPLEERKAAIIAAVIPAMIEHGAALTSRQIAEAAGVAEGTVFRAFGDKETLLREAADVFLDPAPVRAELAAIDAGLALEEKVLAVFRALRDRFRGVINIMAAIGYTGDSPPHVRNGASSPSEYATVVARTLRPELDRLTVPALDVAPFIRLVAFSSALPAFNLETRFDDEHLTRLILYGIARVSPAPAASEILSATLSESEAF
jgi:AcrR family transcriptional regulator